MLKKFLENKPLFYNEIDYNRMPRVYAKIKRHFTQTKVIHILGTNGKGTTGRFLAQALYSLGFKTGHYTSPHIIKFNERIWLNGKNVSDTKLDDAHQFLQSILSIDESNSLSYFEYTTFLAMLIYNECDYIVLEAGLGGEHDATSVFENILTLATPIDFDHESFLGSDIYEISMTKLGAVQKNLILGYQKHPQVKEVALSIEQEKGITFYEVDDLLDEQDISNVKQIAARLSLESFFVDNLKLSVSALKFLKLSYGVENFKSAKMFGRLSKLNENILLDVGHNPLAAACIVKALSPNKYILVYNTYKDKNYQEILTILQPIIEYVEIISVNDNRIEQIEEIQAVLNHLKIQYKQFEKINPHAKYLVFGSFSVAETFLKVFNE